MTDQQIIIPKPEERPTSAWHQEWYRQLEDTWNPPYEIPNIHFHYYHDDFFNRHLSIRAARDWKHHPFWFYIAMMFFAGMAAFHGIGISFRIIKPFIPELDLPSLS